MPNNVPHTLTITKQPRHHYSAAGSAPRIRRPLPSTHHQPHRRNSLHFLLPSPPRRNYRPPSKTRTARLLNTRRATPQATSPHLQTPPEIRTTMTTMTTINLYTTPNCHQCRLTQRKSDNLIVETTPIDWGQQ